VGVVRVSGKGESLSLSLSLLPGRFLPAYLSDKQNEDLADKPLTSFSLFASFSFRPTQTRLHSHPKRP
jgi:hypothetical protein